MMLSELAEELKTGDMRVVVASKDSESGYEAAGWIKTVEHEGELCILID